MENSMSSGERELPERWSAKRKAEIVLRLLRGEDLGEISREIQVAPQVIEEWRRAFLSGAEAGLKSRSRNAEEQELVRTRAKLGETDRKSTRLNSSHVATSYAVFRLNNTDKR